MNKLQAQQQAEVLKQAEEKLHRALSKTFLIIHDWEEAGHTEEEAHRLSEECQKRIGEALINGGGRDAFVALMEEYTGATKASNAYHSYESHLDSLTRLLNGDYIYVPTRYILTSDHDAELVSPVGFTPDDRIWIKPTGYIYMTNRLPSSSNMVYWDVTKNMTGTQDTQSTTTAGA